MILKDIDMLSPQITLFQQGLKSHSSSFSGILTLLTYSIILAMGIYFSLDIIQRQNPSAFYFNRFVEDAGNFPLNSNSMFHFFQFLDMTDNTLIPLDFESVNIVGMQLQLDFYKEKNKDLSKLNHWIYGPCNNTTDTQGISHLINFDLFTESACIRKFYNSNDKKYYDTSDKEFIWPSLDKGCSHPNRTFYGIVIEKCRQSTLNNLMSNKQCKSKEDIQKYIVGKSLNLQLIDQFADVFNYEEPFNKYFYTISGSFAENTIGMNHLNFNPAIVKTHNGFFFDNIIEKLAYFYDLNSQGIESDSTYDIYHGFYFWMQNRMQYYERTYKRIQDVLADIGGMANSLILLATILNTIINKYVTLLDFERLMLDSGPKVGMNKPNMKKNFNHQKNNDKIDNNKKCEDFNKAKDFIRNNLIETENNVEKKEGNEMTFEKDVVNNNNNNASQGPGPSPLTNNYLIPREGQTIVKLLNTRNDQNTKSNMMSQINETDVNKSQINAKEKIKYLQKMKLSFFNYGKNLFCKTNYMKFVYLYNTFRMKLLSEEHLLKSHVYMCKIVETNPSLFKEFNFLDIIDLKNNL